MKVEITVPLPDQRLYPNGRTIWQQKAGLIKASRMESALHCKRAICELEDFTPFEKPLVIATFYRQSTRRADADNSLASLKSVLDGFTDAGLWSDDSVCTFGPVRQTKADNKKHTRVEITVVETPAEFVEMIERIAPLR